MTPIRPFLPEFALEGKTPFDRWSWMAMVYLALPWPFFAIGWLKPGFGWPLVVLLFAMMGLLWRQTRPNRSSAPWWRNALLVGVVLVWTVLGGIGNWMHANPDWFTRYAVLRDLSVGHWPVSYPHTGGDYLLRCPLGYYLPMAALGRWLNVHLIVQLLALWTAAGVLIWFKLLPLARNSATQWGIGIAIVVMFSGMDVLGYALNNGNLPLAGDHIEWWATAFQYSSHTTLLFWVPNHALPAWLAMALFYRHWREPGFLGWAGLCLGLLPLWSPFAALGMLPFYGLAVSRALKTRSRPAPSALTTSLLCVTGFAIGLTSSIYLLASTSHIGHRESGPLFSVGFVRVYLSFVILEFGVLALLIWAQARSAILGVALLVLLCLPLTNFGPSNDLVMRASIPALLVLSITACRYLTEIESCFDKRKRWVVVVLLIGAVTPAEEMIRAFQYRPMRLDTQHTLLENTQGIPEHYVALAAHPWLTSLLRPPTPLRPQPTQAPSLR